MTHSAVFICTSTTKSFFLPLLIGGVFFVCTTPASAQIVINELLPNPEGNDTLGEWVELYNNSDQTIDLSGYYLADESDHHLNLDSLTLGPHQFLQLNHSDNPTFSLNQTDETISLYSPTSLLDSFFYPSSKENLSHGRLPDGVGEWQLNLTPTPGSPNSPPTPTPSAKPTSTPNPTSTSKPTSNPTSKPEKPSPSSPATPFAQTSRLTADPDSTTRSLVLGSLSASPPDSTPTAQATPTASLTSKSTNSAYPLFIAIGGGLFLLAAATKIYKLSHQNFD